MTQEELHLLADIGIGGNHLASSLVHTLGADFAERFPPNANPATMRDAICNHVNAQPCGADLDHKPRPKTGGAFSCLQFYL